MEPCEIWLEDNAYGGVQRSESVGGGCISDARRLYLNSGQTLFAKQLESAPPDMFAAEAAGLQALASDGACRVPQVIHAAETFILLEDLGSGAAVSDFWNTLGRQLAVLHSGAQPGFGFTMNNYCGATAQDNRTESNGYKFFAERRLIALARPAHERGLLSSEELAAVEDVASKLARWIPEMPPCLIHGDLWSGNVHCDKEGQPALIDPAAYWGWAEAELAMTELFGGFPQSFYDSYKEASDVQPDWRERVPLYNLYHLLNHLLLFGSSYHASVRRVLQRYSNNL